MQKIMVQAMNVWEYFMRHKTELMYDIYPLAENEEFGVEISITEDDGCPQIVVTTDDFPCCEETVNTEADCCNVVSELYDKYLTGQFIEGTEDELLDQEDIISQREVELDDAMLCLLDAVMEDDASYVLHNNGVDLDSLCDDLKDCIIEYLVKKYNIKTIRRPMFLKDKKTGDKLFSEYPYEYLMSTE